MDDESLAAKELARRIGECRRLTDAEISCALNAAVRKKREDLVEVLIRLSEFDRRDLSERKGYPTLFDYCTRALRYSRSAAGRRIAVARKGEVFPSLLASIDRGELHLTGAAMLAGLLTMENHREILRRARGKTQEEVAALVAELAPGLRRKDSVRIVASPTGGGAAPPAESSGKREQPELNSAPPPSCAEEGVAEPDLPASSAPPAEAFYRVSFDAAAETLALLRRAQDLLRHRYPAGEIDSIVRLALEGLLSREDFGEREAVPKRRARKKGWNESRYIPQAVKQEVWKRDGGRCVFIGTDGVRCGARSWLEYDHILPRALGGPSDDPANLQLACRTHNQLRARDEFGDRIPKKGRRAAPPPDRGDRAPGYLPFGGA